MRVLLWVVGLFALAVGHRGARATTPAVLLAADPAHRVVNLAAILLLAAVLAFYLLVRTVVLALGMPARAREFRRSQERLRGRRTLQEALKAFFEGRHGRAERAAKEAIELGESPALALTVAARAAHELRSFQSRDEYLQQMEKLAPQDGYLRAMTRAELLLEERRYHDALYVLSQLFDKHTAALKLEMRAHQLARNWDQVLALLPQLEKRKVFEPGVLAQLRHYAQTENLAQKPRRQTCATTGSGWRPPTARTPGWPAPPRKASSRWADARRRIGSSRKAWRRAGTRRCCRCTSTAYRAMRASTWSGPKAGSSATPAIRSCCWRWV
jgi:HemY protein